MNIKEIKEILNLMQEHNLGEIEIEKDGLKLKLKKTATGVNVEHAPESQGVVIPFPKRAEASKSAAAAEAGAGPAEEDPNVYVARSPMVGTFYSAPAPDQPAFASAGQSVKKGSVLCIVEAMKLMNEIKCEVDGKVEEVLVSNGQAVEFDQPLFRIKLS